MYPLRLELRLDGVGGRYVIQLHYEYEIKIIEMENRCFFKKHIYFTIFCFHFASVYGIIFANSRKNF